MRKKTCSTQAQTTWRNQRSLGDRRVIRAAANGGHEQLYGPTESQIQDFNGRLEKFYEKYDAWLGERNTV